MRQDIKIKASALAALALCLGLSACMSMDDPSASTAIREDARCRKLGAVPQTELYIACRREAFVGRDAVYDKRLAEEKVRIAAKEAKREAKRAARAARAEARRADKEAKAEAREAERAAKAAAAR